jgi:hypothetical protein
VLKWPITDHPLWAANLWDKRFVQALRSQRLLVVEPAASPLEAADVSGARASATFGGSPACAPQ